MRTRSRVLLSVAVAAGLLLGLRLALPWVTERYVNRQLAELGEYRGRVEDVDLALLRGAYTVEDMTIVKVGSRAGAPFLDLQRMDVSLQWNALLNGELVGEMVLERPVLNLVQGETESDTQLGTGVNWPEQVREFFPFRFNVVEVRDGTATFRAPGIETDESLTIQNLQVMLRDLTNVEERRDAAFAQLAAEGGVMGDAPLGITGRLDPNESLPTFDVDLSLEGARLVEVNPWLREFVNVDAQRGTFSMYAELAASQGRFEGYLKPIIEDPEIFDMQEEASGPFQKAWEALVELGTNLFKNREEDQVATEIPFAGEIEDPEADLLATMVGLLRNAFVSAFSHSLEGTIGLGDVQVGVSAEEPAQREDEEREGEERDDEAAAAEAPPDAAEAPDSARD